MNAASTRQDSESAVTIRRVESESLLQILLTWISSFHRPRLIGVNVLPKALNSEESL